MDAQLILRTREILGGVLLEMVAWSVPEPVPGCSHHYKYRFYAGQVGGACIARYDNERGKGDHRHIGGREESYRFTSLVRLKNDFMADVMAWLKENEQ